MDGFRSRQTLRTGATAHPHPTPPQKKKKKQLLNLCALAGCHARSHPTHTGGPHATLPRLRVLPLRYIFLTARLFARDHLVYIYAPTITHYTTYHTHHTTFVTYYLLPLYTLHTPPLLPLPRHLHPSAPLYPSIAFPPTPALPHPTPPCTPPHIPHTHCPRTARTGKRRLFRLSYAYLSAASLRLPARRPTRTHLRFAHNTSSTYHIPYAHSLPPNAPLLHSSLQL